MNLFCIRTISLKPLGSIYHVSKISITLTNVQIQICQACKSIVVTLELADSDHRISLSITDHRCDQEDVTLSVPEEVNISRVTLAVV